MSIRLGNTLIYQGSNFDMIPLDLLLAHRLFEASHASNTTAGVDPSSHEECQLHMKFSTIPIKETRSDCTRSAVDNIKDTGL